MPKVKNSRNLSEEIAFRTLANNRLVAEKFFFPLLLETTHDSGVLLWTTGINLSYENV